MKIDEIDVAFISCRLTLVKVLAGAARGEKGSKGWRDRVRTSNVDTRRLVGLKYMLILALEMDYLRRSARVSRLQKLPNTTIRCKMQAEQSILDRIQRRQFEMVWTTP